MAHLISALFIIEFFLILLIMLYTLLKKGVTFKVGVSFGVLFFVFIPVWIMILTGSLDLSKADFSYTTLTDIVLNKNIHSSLLLLGYLFSILLYLYFPSRYSTIDVNNKWNGTYNGKPVQIDVYVWKVSYRTEEFYGSLKKRQQVGTVTVLR